jgi:hypothetical protein
LRCRYEERKWKLPSIYAPIAREPKKYTPPKA